MTSVAAGLSRDGSLASGVLSAEERRRISVRLGAGLAGTGLLGLGTLLVHLAPDQWQIGELVRAAAALVVGAPILASGMRGIVTADTRRATDQLVAIAVLAAAASGNMVTATLIPLFLEVGRLFEERSSLGARAAIDGIRALAARQAVKWEDGVERRVDPDSLAPGDEILVRPGERIPVDGTVLVGRAAVDQSAVTGESRHEDVGPGSPLFAGTVALDGLLRVQVRGTGADTVLGRVVGLLADVERASVPVLRLFERRAGRLVAAGPDPGRHHALLHGRPVPRDRRAGGGDPDGAGGRRPGGDGGRDDDRHPPPDPDQEHGLPRARLRGGHPDPRQDGHGDRRRAGGDAGATRSGDLAGASARSGVARAASGRCTRSPAPWSPRPAREGCRWLRRRTCEERPGLGVVARVEGQRALLGRRALLAELGTDPGGDEEGDGAEVWVALGSRSLGRLVLRDQPREDAGGALADMRALGIDRLVLLTGDREGIAQEVGHALGMDEVVAEVLPEQKLEVVRAEQAAGRTVMMVGDGVNDALALGGADVGVAIGAEVNEVALGGADVALLGADLARLPALLRLADTTRRVIGQNVWLAFGLAGVLIALAATGVLDPLTGALAQSVAVIAVVANSARILRFDRSPGVPAQRGRSVGENFLEMLPEPDEVPPTQPDRNGGG